MAPDDTPAPETRQLDDAMLRRWPLPTLSADDDKESRGRVVIVAGCREIPGAAILAAQAALRAGAGKVLIATSASVATAVAVAVPETRVVALDETASGGIAVSCAAHVAGLATAAGALLIGPGLQDDESSCDFVRALLALTIGKVPMVLDAAAMAAIHTIAPANGHTDAPVLLTPHAGEMAFLSGRAKAAVLADPRASALEAARRWNAVVALKGALTVIAHPDGHAWLHEGGNIGLATAGSGDTLAGLIAGFAARGAPLEQAAAWGVVVHAHAGERLARRLGGLGYLARELAAEVPALLDSLCIDDPSGLGAP